MENLKIKRFQRINFEVESNCPIFARIILFFMLPKFISKINNIVVRTNRKELKHKTIYFIPRFKVRRYED